MSRARVFWLMVACLLLAALLRLPALTQAPPGLHYDEAANAILAAEIGAGAERPVFIPSYTGKEVLYFYGAGFLLRTLGESVFALRLASAFVGLLTIAATYWLGRELLADRRVAALAAALLAVSFWHLVFSRLGFRAITQPLLQALTVAALFRGLKGREHRRWFIVAGFCLGLTGYTYLAARLFPLPLAIALLPLLASRERRSQRLRQIGLMLAVALLVLAPLLVYFYRNPEAFWVRILQVAPAADGLTGQVSLLENYLRSLGMFFLVGDPYWRFNIPGRPLFNWFWGGLALVGWGVTLWRWRRDWYDWQKSAVLLLLTVPFLMILPTALATGEIIPSNLRAIGLIPFLFYLPALGLVTLVERVADVIRRPDSRTAAFLRYLSVLDHYDVNYVFIVLLVLVGGGMFAAHTYFQEWAMRADLFYDSDADLVAIAGYLNGGGAADATVYVAAEHFRHPTLAFLAERYDTLKWLPGGDALALPPAGDAVYVYPHSVGVPQWAEPYLAPASRGEGPLGPDDMPLFVTYRLQATASLSPTVSERADFDGSVTLLGYEAAGGESGKTLPLTVFWRVEEAPSAPLLPFVHLEDAWGRRWGQMEPGSYPAAEWAAGETVIQHITMPIPAGTPPGVYSLRFGFFDTASGARLAHLDSAGRFAGDSVVLAEVPVTIGEPHVLLPAAPRGVPQTVRPGLQLLGYERDDLTHLAGAQLPLLLWWHATEPQPPLTVRLEMYRADETGVILTTTKPVHGTYPFDTWTAPLLLRDPVDPRLPRDLESGTYRLHLRVMDEASRTIFTSSLGVVSVTATEHVFKPPAVTYPLAATFADEIELRGYNLEALDARRFGLQLVWQAIAPPAGDYTVFVHVLEQNGTCCLWQEDAMPQQGQYRTSLWLEGEVVVDDYLIQLPADTASGRYPLEIGLYLPESGQRLQIVQPDLPDSDALFLRPLKVE